MNIHVGNLATEVTEADLRQAFEAFGQVASAAVIMDRDTRQSRGFGFVDMPNDDQARAAMEGLNGHDLKGKPLRLSEARSQGGRGGGRGPRRDAGSGRGRFGSGDASEGRGSAGAAEDFR